MDGGETRAAHAAFDFGNAHQRIEGAQQSAGFGNGFIDRRTILRF
jgi:hypothetical protein